MFFITIVFRGSQLSNYIFYILKIKSKDCQLNADVILCIVFLKYLSLSLKPAFGNDMKIVTPPDNRKPVPLLLEERTLRLSDINEDTVTAEDIRGIGVGSDIEG